MKIRFVIFSLVLAVFSLSVRADDQSYVPLRQTFPAGSIDSLDKADAALAAAQARHDQLNTEFNIAERACYKKFFANDCIDDLKANNRIRQADVSSVELEANRFKRALHDQQSRDQKAQKEADKKANAAQDAATREQNRLNFEQKQADNQHHLQDAANKQSQAAPNAAAYNGKVTSNAQSQTDRAKKVAAADARADKAEADQKQKEADANARREHLARHRAEKAADRAKRAAAQNGAASSAQGSSDPVAAPVNATPAAAAPATSPAAPTTPVPVTAGPPKSAPAASSASSSGSH